MNMSLADARSADTQTLVEIYEQHSPGLFRYAIRLLSNEDMAEECVAETFSRFLHALRDGGGPSVNIQAYLYRMAHNWITDYYRRQPPPPLTLEPDLYTDPKGNPAQIVAQQLGRERVRAAILRLPPEQQKVIMLRFLEGWTHREVASTLGKTLGATRALQYRALSALRRILIELEE